MFLNAPRRRCTAKLLYIALGIRMRTLSPLSWLRLVPSDRRQCPHQKCTGYFRRVLSVLNVDTVKRRRDALRRPTAACSDAQASPGWIFVYSVHDVRTKLPAFRRGPGGQWLSSLRARCMMDKISNAINTYIFLCVSSRLRRSCAWDTFLSAVTHFQRIFI